MMRPRPSYPRYEPVKANQRDQRNTLELFIYDTRSKLSSAYQSLTTDTEKEVITDILLETEDQLNKESEHDYTGKLEYLKKLLEPIENRYEEENARAKAEKDLQTCIAKYRSLADSLLARQKEEVKILCNRAERFLNRISQQHSFPKSSSSYINEAIESFESDCRTMMRTKPSHPRHEPMDSNKRDQGNTLKLFIYDTHSKLLGAYQSITTDAEKEVITGILIETEDWLNEESEQDYSGKLEYLKKLLEPIENRHEEENARAKAEKALQTCIAKYHSLADSLPARLKEEPLSSYKSFTTDSEKEGLTKSLQETENSDGESEQGYAGKLEGLKKVRAGKQVNQMQHRQNESRLPEKAIRDEEHRKGIEESQKREETMREEALLKEVTDKLAAIERSLLSHFTHPCHSPS